MLNNKYAPHLKKKLLLKKANYLWLIKHPSASDGLATMFTKFQPYDSQRHKQLCLCHKTESMFISK